MPEARSKPPQTNDRAMRSAIGLSCLLGILNYTVASLSAGFAVLVGGGVLLAWTLCAGSGRVAPRRAINAGLLGVVGFGVFQSLRIGFTVEAFAYFIGLLLVVKLLDLRRTRDWGQALTLATALVIAGALTNNSLSTGVLLFVSTLVLLRAVLRYQICAAEERAGAESANPLVPAYRRSLRRTQWGITTALLIAGTVVFMFLPRELGTEAFGRWGGAAVGQTTGFADEVELGQPGLVSQSPTPVMDVTVTNREGVNMGAIDSPPIYLRGAVLERYESGRWVRSRRADRASFRRAESIPASMSFRPWRAVDRAVWDTQLNVTIRSVSPSGRSPLFTAWEPLEFAPLGIAREISYDDDIGTVYVEDARGRVEYRVRVSDPDLREIPLSVGGTRSDFPPTDIHPGIRAYAESVLTEFGIAPSPDERPIAEDHLAVRALQNHLRTRFTYTLEDQPTPPGRDATEWFLEERRTGHCEYFASALAMMCRSVGINARVVTGYIVSDFNEVTRQYVVRESSAHAWVEAEVAPGFWRTYDGTPQAEFHQIHQPEPGFMRSISNLFETIEFAWVNGVVAYDAESRRAVFGPLASDFGLLKVAARMIRRLEIGGVGLVLRAFAVGFVVFVVATLIGLIAMHQRRFFEAIVGGFRSLYERLMSMLTGRRPTPAETLHTELLRTLDAAGVPKPGHTPLLTHIRHASLATLPDAVSHAIARGCELLYLDRFGRIAADPEDVAKAIAVLRASEKVLREHPRPSN